MKLADTTARKYFLPGGIALALILGLLAPSPGRAAGNWAAAGLDSRILAVLGIFLATGYCLRLRRLAAGRGFAAAGLTAVGLNLLAAPALAVGLGMLLRPPEEVLIGLIVFAAVPTTLASSTVISVAAGGNAAWAVGLMVLLSLSGTLLMPFTLGWGLETALIEIDRWGLLLKVLTLVVLPLAAGWVIGKQAGRRGCAAVNWIPPALVVFIVWVSVSAQSEALRVFPPALVVFIVWVSVSAQSAALRVFPPAWALGTVGISLGFHFILLALALAGGRFLGLKTPERRSFLFVSAQKSLPVTIAVLALLGQGPQAARALPEAATAAAVLLYFPHVLFDAALAAWLRGRKS